MRARARRRRFRSHRASPRSVAILLVILTALVAASYNWPVAWLH